MDPLKVELELNRSVINMNRAHTVDVLTHTIQRLDDMGLHKHSQAVQRMLSEVAPAEPEEQPELYERASVESHDDLIGPGTCQMTPAVILTQAELDTALLIKSRCWKILVDLPSGSRYRELTVEQLHNRLDHEIGDTVRYRQRAEQRELDEAKEQRVASLIEQLRKEGIDVAPVGVV